MIMRQYYAALTITLLSALSAVQAQRGSSGGCSLPANSCNHTISVQPTNLQFSPNQNTISFKPERPGTYQFRYEATDLCKSISETTQVVARCPPAPIPKAELASGNARANIVFQNNQAVLNGASSTAGWSGGAVRSYEWKILSGPAESDYVVRGDDKKGTVLSSSATFTTPKLTIAGEYKFTLGVSDGCSKAMTIVCFTVECNCGPTANAGATTTVWTNAGPDTNDVMTNKRDNQAGINNGPGSGLPYWILDGSLSYDFDKNEMLSYTWDFIEWKSVSPQQTWSQTTNVLPTTGGRGGNVGYKTVCTESSAASSSFYSRKCQFLEIPASASSGNRVLDPVDGRALRQSTRKVPSFVTSSVVPLYVTVEEDFNIPTTSCKANINKTVETSYQVTPYEQLITEVSGSVATQTVLCEIQIYQRAADANQVARNNPKAYLSVNSIKKCMGLWSFRLTVKDACGSATQSIDDITVHVRCNEPPVAIAACNNTQEWKGSFFDQVDIDGRSSSDPDGGSLSYTWSFVDTPRNHCPKAHIACKEDFCRNPNYFTAGMLPDQGLVFGPSPGVDSTCSPTVFPVIKDRTLVTSTGCTPPGTCPAGQTCNICQYQTVAPTQFHVGNSAYFTPSKQGTYQVRLQVDDGCNVATTDVWIFAECPTMTVAVTIADNVATIQPGSQPQTSLTSAVFYQGASEFLTYQWSAQSTTANAVIQFTNPTGTESNAVASQPGTYTITLTVSDSCQEMQSPPVSWRVTCNSSPTTPQLVMTSPAAVGSQNTVYFDGIQFPRITINGSSVDTDPLTYSWSINEADNQGFAALQVDYGASGATQNQLSFTPPAGTGGTRSYSILTTAFDKCTESLAGQITIALQCNGTLTASAGRDQSESYDYAASRFKEATFSAAASVWPYQSVQGAQKNWQWSVLYFDTPQLASGSLVQTGVQGSQSETFRITPVRVGTYRVTLTINDGCAEAAQTVNLITRCDTPAIARVGSPTVSVEWNSYLGNAGGFAPVEMDGSTSSGDARSTVTYIWAPANLLVGAGGSVSLNTPKVVYTPTGPGSTQFTLKVHNGPCPLSTEARVQVSAVCNTLNALLQEPGSLSGRGGGATSQYVKQVQWDGTRFPTICLDGTATSYTNRNGTAGKFDILKYTWQMTSAPAGSVFQATFAPVTETAAAKQNNTYGIGGFLDQKLDNSTADVTITLRKWEMLTETTTTSVVTYLNNHHYNRPYTCFRPDIAGSFSVALKVTDGCTSSDATASVTARCNSAPVVAFTSAANVQLSGRSFVRVALTSQVSFPAGETLSYQWTLVTAPRGSTLKVNSSLHINNNQAPAASFVPDMAGSYSFTFMAKDGCNAEVTQTLTIQASCNSLMSIAPLETTPEFIDYNPTSIKDRTDFQIGNNDGMFKLVGATNDNCQVTGTRWFFVARTCGTHFVPDARPPPVTAAPVAAGCEMKKECQWELIETPCTSLAVNPGYRAPRLTSQKGSCSIEFKCQYPGTYKMKFTTKTNCASDEEIVTIVCRCQKKIKADAGNDQMSLKQCKSANTYDYDEITLRGGVSYDPRDNSIDTVQKCPSTKLEEISCAGKLDCCPSAPECCAPNCPACPQCPQCPTCPTASAGAVPVPVQPAVPVPGAVPGAVPVAPGALCFSSPPGLHHVH